MAEARCRIPTRQRLHCASQFWHPRPPAAPNGIPWRGGRGRAGRLGPEEGGSADDREGGRGGDTASDDYCDCGGDCGGAFCTCDEATDVLTVTVTVTVAVTVTLTLTLTVTVTITRTRRGGNGRLRRDGPI